MVVRPEGHYTKHIYVNSERIASKIGNPEDYAGGDPTGSGSAVGRKIKMEEVVEENFNELFGNVPEIEQAAEQDLGMSTGNTEPEQNSYWFTSDHLGSSAFITNGSGVAIQHLEIDRREIREPPLKQEQGREQYMAFGEIFVDQRRTGFGTPYKFNAKELDCESGYYYYGARYYDPRMARFLSVDPLAGDFPSWTSYHYVHNNPLRYTDPTGMRAEESDGVIVGNNGRLIGNDGKEDDKIYVTNTNISRKDRKFIKKNSGNAEAFSNSNIYESLTEIESSQDTRQAMLDAVSGDDGNGGTGAANNREYGGSIMPDGSVVSGKPGPVTTPREGATFDDYQLNDKTRFHSHPSGTIREGAGTTDPFGGSTTLGSTQTIPYSQPPSGRDIQNASSVIRYVFGKGSGIVYMYNNRGVRATLPIRNFVKFR